MASLTWSGRGRHVLAFTARPARRWALWTRVLGAWNSATGKGSDTPVTRWPHCFPEGTQTADRRGHRLAKPTPASPILSECTPKAGVHPKLNQLSGWSCESLTCDNALQPKLGQETLIFEGVRRDRDLQPSSENTRRPLQRPRVDQNNLANEGACCDG